MTRTFLPLMVICAALLTGCVNATVYDTPLTRTLKPEIQSQCAIRLVGGRAVDKMRDDEKFTANSIVIKDIRYGDGGLVWIYAYIRNAQGAAFVNTKTNKVYCKGEKVTFREISPVKFILDNGYPLNVLDNLHPSAPTRVTSCSNVSIGFNRFGRRYPFRTLALSRRAEECVPGYGFSPLSQADADKNALYECRIIAENMGFKPQDCAIAMQGRAKGLYEWD